MSLNYLTIDKFSEVSDYTRDAFCSNIKRGQWLEGREWKKAPDGQNLISIEGYESADQISHPAITKHRTKPNPVSERRSPGLLSLDGRTPPRMGAKEPDSRIKTRKCPPACTPLEVNIDCLSACVVNIKR